MVANIPRVGLHFMCFKVISLRLLFNTVGFYQFITSYEGFSFGIKQVIYIKAKATGEVLALFSKFNLNFNFAYDYMLCYWCLFINPHNPCGAIEALSTIVAGGDYPVPITQNNGNLFFAVTDNAGFFHLYRLKGCVPNLVPNVIYSYCLLHHSVLLSYLTISNISLSGIL